MNTLYRAIVFNNTSKVIAGVSFRFSSSSTDVPNYENLAVSVPKKYVYHVELNRPKKLNTFNNSMWQELRQCFGSLSANPECRVIILSGQGKHFTGGLDLNSMMEFASKLNDFNDVARKARLVNIILKSYQDGITSLEECVKPVISVVHSACVGAGVNLITAADIRYCTSDAWFQLKELDIGMAADVGALQRLPKVIGSGSIARDICLTGRKVDSKEALDIGLVSKVFPDKHTAIQQVLEVAETIASKSPVAVQVTKQNLVYSQSRTNEEGLQHIRLLNQLMLQSEDLSKGAMAQLTKDEKPEFDKY